MARKHIVRVVLSPQHKELLDHICAKLGQSESETLRIAFLDYAKSISLVTEKVHSR
ncbi:MAG: ribbon-helix-helix protein, CopG family [Candidatus Bathyarchaeia archaeon]